MKRVMLMTKAIERRIPPLYAQDGKGYDATVYCKLFTPDSDHTWLLTEYDPVNRRAFGLAYRHQFADQCPEGELGYVSLAELEGAKGPWGLPVERDCHFKPCTLREALAKGEVAGYGGRYYTTKAHTPDDAPPEMPEPPKVMAVDRDWRCEATFATLSKSYNTVRPNCTPPRRVTRTNCTIDDYRRECKISRRKVAVKITHVATFAPAAYYEFSNNLMTDHEWLAGKGGTLSDYELAHGIEGYIQLADDERKAWRLQSYVLGVLCVNEQTGECFIVDPQGYAYARYVGLWPNVEGRATPPHIEAKPAETAPETPQGPATGEPRQGATFGRPARQVAAAEFDAIGSVYDTGTF